MEGLEPPRITPPDPKSGAATNYATCARKYKQELFAFILRTFLLARTHTDHSIPTLESGRGYQLRHMR